MKPNWNEVLIRSSCTGKILANGKGTVLTEKQQELLNQLQTKTSLTPAQETTLNDLIKKRDAPPTLGDTCISYLKEVYVWEKYGKEPVGGSARSKYTMKGLIVEDESIGMLDRLDGMDYKKNEEWFKNDYLSGTPDIIVRNEAGLPIKIIDIKSSYDFSTLLANDGSPLNPLYYAQMQSYMALTGATEAEVCYCLVNMPQEQIEAEKRRLYYALNAATEESPEYVREVEKMLNNFEFDEVPIQERILRFPVQRDNNFIFKLYNRVIECRKWLQDYDDKRMSIYSK